MPRPAAIASAAVLARAWEMGNLAASARHRVAVVAPTDSDSILILGALSHSRRHLARALLSGSFAISFTLVALRAPLGLVFYALPIMLTACAAFSQGILHYAASAVVRGADAAFVEERISILSRQFVASRVRHGGLCATWVRPREVFSSLWVNWFARDFVV